MVSPGKVVAMDKWQAKWLKDDRSFSAMVQAEWTPLPEDSDAYAAAYGYPSFAFGARYGRNDVTMHRSPDPAWGFAEEVGYDSKLGDIVSAYASFRRDVARMGRFSAGYSLSLGLAYGKHKYGEGNIDNELTGSRWLIYFAAGLHAMYRVDGGHHVMAGVDFHHHSNGALNRPNKGANYVGPAVGYVYRPAAVGEREKTKAAPFRRSLYGVLTVGVGGKTLDEDWQLTQFGTPKGEPGYRTSRFRFHPAYSLQADLMCRWALRWSSGIGADLFYGTYAGRVAELDSGKGYAKGHSPWSVGVAAKHSAHWHNWQAAMSLGVYLHRRMGRSAEEVEKPYYERIGVRYSFPGAGGLQVGFDVKAHLTKADFTEITVGIPLGVRR